MHYCFSLFSCLSERFAWHLVEARDMLLDIDCSRCDKKKKWHEQGGFLFFFTHRRKKVNLGYCATHLQLSFIHPWFKFCYEFVFIYRKQTTKFVQKYCVRVQITV